MTLNDIKAKLEAWPPIAFLLTYLGNVWSAVSQLANVVFLFGQPNESISGRCYRQSWLPAMRVINALLWWQNQHCRGAYNNDRTWAIDAAKWPERVERSEPPYF
jgi:hypothetical protein